MFTISTCGWCKQTKQFMKRNEIEHEFIDVDKLKEKDREVVYKDIRGRGGRLSFPTIIIDNKSLITGFRKDEISKALGL